MGKSLSASAHPNPQLTRQMPTLCPRYGKRTTANGLQLTLGNASGIMAPFI